MGFYGNIADTSRIHFQFDKIFSSKWEMESEVNRGTDGIFSGRFVLIKYGEDGNVDNSMLIGYADSFNSNNVPTTIYADITCTQEYIYTDFTQVSQNNENNWNDYYYKIDNKFYPLLSKNYYNSSTQYYIESVNNPNNLPVVYTDQIIRLRDFDGVFTSNYYKCTGPKTSGSTIPKFQTIIPDQFYTTYQQNYNIDKSYYGQDFDPRGYDGTVWEKVYTGGNGKFIHVASLNSFIPDLDLAADAPSLPPTAPYIEGRSGGGLYRIHVPSHWGFRIKQATNLDKSDQQVSQPYYQYDENNNLVGRFYYTIDADIYFNKAGFSPTNRVISTDANEILLTADGESGKTYFDINNVEHTIDMQQLAIHVPALGNMVAAGYDLIYGVTGDGKKRYPNIKWYDASAPEDVKLNGNSVDGLKTHDLNTIAGTLNTIHDRLGQIVYHLDNNTGDSQAASMPTNYIYEKNGRYYRVGTKYRHEELVYEPNNPNTPIDFKEVHIDSSDYVGNKYYVQGNNSFIPATGNFSSSEHYFLKYINKIRYTPVTLKQFQPGQYYIHDEGDNWICDYSPYPSNPNTRYYKNIVATQTPNFTGSYQASLYYTMQNGDYILSNDAVPTINTTYYEINRAETVVAANKLLYVKGVFYERLSNGEYQIVSLEPNEVNYDQIYYVLTFSSVIQVGQDMQGNPILYYRKETETPVYLTRPPADINNLFFKDANNNYISYQNLGSQPVEDGKNPYTVGRALYRLTTTPHLNDLYVPNFYYTYDDDENSETYKSYFKATDAFTVGTIYYYITSWQEELTKFYIPGLYWYEFAEDDFQPATETNKIHSQYYTKATFYAKDANQQFPDWYEWSDYVAFIPPSVSIYTREEYIGFVEIAGFSNNTNSINGMILNLAQTYDLDDVYTRNINSYRGAFNKINDLLYQIRALRPGQILYVNEYGQIDSLPKSETTSTDYFNYQNLKQLYQRVAAIEARLS